MAEMRGHLDDQLQETLAELGYPRYKVSHNHCLINYYTLLQVQIGQRIWENQLVTDMMHCFACRIAKLIISIYLYCYNFIIYFICIKNAGESGGLAMRGRMMKTIDNHGYGILRYSWVKSFLYFPYRFTEIPE